MSPLLEPGGRDGGGTVVIAVPATPSALAEGEAILEALFTQAPIGIAVYDRNLRFVRVNAALERIHGFPAEKALGRPVSEVLPGLDAMAIERRLKGSWRAAGRSSTPSTKGAPRPIRTGTTSGTSPPSS